MEAIGNLYEYKFYFIIMAMGPPLKMSITIMDTNVENAKKKLIAKLQQKPEDIKKEYMNLSVYELYNWWNLDTKVKPCHFSTAAEFMFGDGFILNSNTPITLRDYINTCIPIEKKLIDISINAY
jgi:hypothetical protein